MTSKKLSALVITLVAGSASAHAASGTSAVLEQLTDTSRQPTIGYSVASGSDGGLFRNAILNSAVGSEPSNPEARNVRTRVAGNQQQDRSLFRNSILPSAVTGPEQRGEFAGFEAR